MNDADPCLYGRCGAVSVELWSCTGAHRLNSAQEPSVSHAAPKIDFGEARFRCVAFLPMNRGEIMWYVMCACVVHAPQVISRLQESTIYESLTGEVAAVLRFEEYLPLAS